MKKIGILTLSASNNCGSLLQAYSLQTVLKEKFNCKVEIIDFRSKASNKIYSIFPSNPLKEIFRFLNALFNYKQIKNEVNSYENFRKKYLLLTKNRYKSNKDLKKLNGHYDCIIVGSDQVWNVKMKDFDNAFFLEWSNTSKKIAYAVSLGGHEIYEAKNWIDIVGWLQDFEKISVREDFGYYALNRVLKNKRIDINIDPTLLLKHEDWINITNKRIIKHKYIFYYSWAYNSDRINKLVKEFSKKFNLPVIVINISKWKKYKPNRYGFSLCKEMGPEAFLNLMKYAEYALVQSFHGVILSYQMKKNFWLLDNNSEDHMDKRLKQIIDTLSVKNRVLRRNEDVYAIKDVNIDYNNLKNNLDKYRKRSLDYLNEIF